MGAVLGILARLGKPLARGLDALTVTVLGVTLFGTASALDRAAPWLALGAVAFAVSRFAR